MNLGVCFKKFAARQIWRVFACLSIKIRVFPVSGLTDENLIKNQTYTKNETCKLYSRVSWTFLPNGVVIDPNNFELYHFKAYAFFETQCSCYCTCYWLNVIVSQLRAPHTLCVHLPYLLVSSDL